jgi:hypothetical protein
VKTVKELMASPVFLGVRNLFAGEEGVVWLQVGVNLK